MKNKYAVVCWCKSNSDLLKEWDYEKNSKLKIIPNNISYGSAKKVYWICKRGHSYCESVYNRLHGRGCPYCSNRRILMGYNDLATTNPELLEEWDYERNDKFGITPNNISYGFSKKVWWKCKQGHDWSANVNSRVKGSGCPYCSNNKVWMGYNDLATTHPELLKEWDYEKNNKIGITPTNITYGSTKEVWWKCKQGHEWSSRVNQRTSKSSNCPYCSNQKLLVGYNDFATLYPELLKEWDYERNDLLDITPQSIIRGGKIEINWICSKGHRWKSTIAGRIKNGNFFTHCPVCSNGTHTSIPEKILFYYIRNIYQDAVANYKPDWLKPRELDIFIPSLRLGIEYDGSYFHENESKENVKDELCKKNDISLIRIKDYDAKIFQNSSSIVYQIKEKCNSNYTYMEDALSYLEKFLNIHFDYDINRDFKEIMKYINLYEKENCLSVTNPEVLDEWDYEKNSEMGITPQNILSGSSFKVWWKCKQGHEYPATIATKINQKTSCPYCANKKILVGYNDLATTNPELLEEWNYEKNDKLGITPQNIFKGSNKKVYWRCKAGHSYPAIVNNRTRGHCCPYCSGRMCITGISDLATTNPELLEEWNYEKNDKIGLTPFNLGKGYDKKVYWKCKMGHEWSASINNRVNHHSNCPYCSNRRILKGYNDLATTNPELLEEWDYEKNDKIGLTPFNLSKGSGKKVWWKCEKGHSYISEVRKHVIDGNRCPYCSNNKILVGYNDLATTNPELLEEWDYERNLSNGFTPQNISKSCSKKLFWKCKYGHHYETYVYNKRKGFGDCPYCRMLKND